MAIIADHANPFYLKELYLDGCEQINDAALTKLTKPRADGLYTNIDFERQKLNHSILKQYMEATVSGSRELILNIQRSGVGGLEAISLSECRQISESGILKLAKCSLLRKVCFLGCGSLKD